MTAFGRERTNAGKGWMSVSDPKRTQPEWLHSIGK